MVYKKNPSFNLKTKEHSANDFTKFLGTTYFHTNNSVQESTWHAIHVFMNRLFTACAGLQYACRCMHAAKPAPAVNNLFM